MKHFIIKTLLLAFCLIIVSFSVVFSSELPQTFLSIKSAGMGGVGVSTPDPETILYLNPAGLTELDRWRLALGNGSSLLGTDLISKGKSWYDAFKKSTTTDKLNAISVLVPTRFDLGLSAYPVGLLNYMTPSFGVGISGNLKLISAVLNPVIPRFEGYVIADGAANFAYARQLRDNISIGGNIKYLYRAATYNPSTETNSIQITASDALNKAANYSYYKVGGIGFDIGLLGKFDNFAGKTNIGLSFNNIAANLKGTRIDKSTSNDVQTAKSQDFSTTIPMVTTIGISLMPSWKLPLGLLDETTLAFDYKTGIPNQESLRNIHLGYEKKFGRLSLRMGLNDSYVVGGFGLDLGGIKVNYAYYAEEGGATLGSVPVVSHMLSGSLALSGKPQSKKAAAPYALKKGPYFVNISSPKNKSTTTEESILLSGNVDNADMISGMLINGKQVMPFISQNNFEVSYPVNRGSNTFNINIMVASPETGSVSAEAVVLKVSGIKDVLSGNFAFDAINYLSSLSIMTGYPDETFRPDNPITRAELVSLLIKAKNIVPEENTTSQFIDLPDSHWAAKYASEAVKSNIVSGYADHTFKPSKNVTRAEAATIIAKFAGINESDFSSFMRSPYPDVLPSHWAAKYILAAKEQGFLEFLPSNIFEPNKNTTRAEIAFMISKTPVISKLIDRYIDYTKSSESPATSLEALELYPPQDNSATYFDSILVSGKVLDKNVSGIFVNSEKIQATSFGRTFIKSVVLHRGENILGIRALDKSGKELLNVKRTVYRF